MIGKKNWLFLALLTIVSLAIPVGLQLASGLPLIQVTFTAAWKDFCVSFWYVALAPFFVGTLISLYKHRFSGAVCGLLASVPISFLCAFAALLKSL